MSEETKDQAATQEQADSVQEDQNQDVPAEENEASETDLLRQELKESQAKQEELKDRMLRVQADFENFKKRTQREKQDLARYTLEGFIKKLLPVLDNFDRAIDHAGTDNMEAYRQGVEMVYKQFKDVLEAEGLKEIECTGQAFDPNYHHGVAVDSNPEAEDQHITEVFQKGYQLGDKVLRPALVKVNQK